MTEVQLVPLEASDREQFIKDNQEAFNYGALEEFGRRDDHFECLFPYVSECTGKGFGSYGQGLCISSAGGK